MSFKNSFRNTLKSRTIWLSAGVAALLAILFISSRESVPAVIVTQVRRGLIRQEISDFGTTRFKNIYTLLAPSNGWIAKINVSVGERVTQGVTTVLTLSAGPSPLLDPRTRAALTAQWQSTRAQADQANAQWRRLKLVYQAAQNELRRSEVVYQTGGISLQEIENLRSRVVSLREEVRAMQAGLDAAIHQRDAARAAMSPSREMPEGETEIHSPKSGIVSWIYDEKPRFVALGSPILDVAQAGDLQFEIDILARDAMNLRVGLPVRFSELPVKAHIRAISPTALPKISPLGVSEQRTRVWMEFESALPPQVPAGLELEAHIELAQKTNTLKIDKTAVWKEQNMNYVFRTKEGNLEKTAVTCGIQSARDIEILTGINEGDWIVQLPTDDMHGGEKVVPQKSERKTDPP